MSHFCVDCNIRFSVTVKNFSGTPIDPSGLSITLQPRVGQAVTKVYGTDAELVRDGAGIYHYDHIMDQGPGEWIWKWKSTGTGAGAHSGTIRIEPD